MLNMAVGGGLLELLGTWLRRYDTECYDIFYKVSLTSAVMKQEISANSASGGGEVFHFVLLANTRIILDCKQTKAGFLHILQHNCVKLFHVRFASALISNLIPQNAQC